MRNSKSEYLIICNTSWKMVSISNKNVGFFPHHFNTIRTNKQTNKQTNTQTHTQQSSFNNIDVH